MQAQFKDGSIMISGLLPKNAEYRQVGAKNSSLTQFSVKVGEKLVNGQKEAIWVNCKCWHGVARAAKELKKSDVVLCVGRKEVENYTDKNGVQQTVVRLVVEYFNVMPQPGASPQSTQNSGLPDRLDDFEELLTDDGLPF